MDWKKQYIEEKGYSNFNKYNENDYTIFLEQKLTETNQALQLLQHDVISSGKPEWLRKDIIDSVKNLWDSPNENNSNPRTSAIKLVRKQAKHYGYEIDLKKAVEIVKEHCL